MIWSRLLALCIILAALSGCSYHFQGAHNPLKDVGIERIYVTEFRNSTYRPGIEHVFTSAMVREIQKSRSFTLVNSEKEADAILRGEVVTADAASSSPKTLVINDIGGKKKAIDVAAHYSASVVCNVELVDKNGRIVFTRSQPGSRTFPGAARTGSQGATASLVNDSEQRLAIHFLASQMMASVYQRMIDAF